MLGGRAPVCAASPQFVLKAPRAQLVAYLRPTGPEERPNLQPHWVTHIPISRDGGPMHYKMLFLVVVVGDPLGKVGGRVTRRAVTTGTGRGAAEELDECGAEGWAAVPAARRRTWL